MYFKMHFHCFIKKVTFNCKITSLYFPKINTTMDTEKKVSKIKKQNFDLFHKVLVANYVLNN